MVPSFSSLAFTCQSQWTDLSLVRNSRYRHPLRHNSIPPRQRHIIHVLTSPRRHTEAFHSLCDSPCVCQQNIHCTRSTTIFARDTYLKQSSRRALRFRYPPCLQTSTLAQCTLRARNRPSLARQIPHQHPRRGSCDADPRCAPNGRSGPA